MKLDTVRARASLIPRRDPYFVSLGQGRALGFRKLESGGTWVARLYDPATRKNTTHGLGDFPGVDPSDQYARAVKAAQEWFKHCDGGGVAEALTVRQACDRYVAKLRRTKGDEKADDAEARLRRHVHGKAIARIEVAKLTKAHVGAWREELESSATIPQKRGPNCRTKTPPKSKPRSQNTIARDMVPLRAALNDAMEDGYVTTDAAWIVKLQAPEITSGGRKTVYLSRDQRRAMFEKTYSELRPLVHAMCLVPIRPGALAALRVSDFDAANGALFVGKDKAGAGRWVPVSPALRALLKDQAKGKTPAALLFGRRDGSPINKDFWKGPIKDAAKLAGLPEGTTIYTLRHSTITDLVVDGLDVMHVAALAGTSVAMIQKHYGHLQPGRASAAMQKLAI